MTGRASGRGLRRVLQCAIATLLLSFATLIGHTQESPSLKEILGRAQSDAERKAVEDLIGKLQGKSVRPAKPVSDTPAPQPVTPDQAAVVKDSVEHGSAKASPEPTEQPSLASKSPPQSESDTSEAAAQPLTEPAAASAEQLPAEQPAVAKPEPEPAEAVVEKAERKELPSIDLEVLFEFDSAKLTPAAVETLTTLGRALIDERLAGSDFLIGGHTDAKGRASYNRRLSERRAEAVRAFLIAIFAIAPDRLTAKGFGARFLKNPEHPRAPENRRVQVVNVSEREARR